MKKKTTLAIMILFFVAMLILNLISRPIHNRMIPNVTVGRLTQEKFQIKQLLSDGAIIITETKQKLAIPKELYHSGKVFVVTTGEKNGDIRTFAKAYEIQIGMENEKYYEVTNQFFDRKLQFILNNYMKIKDGDEVYVVN